MTGRRAIVGLCMLCALALSAMAAPGATAASNGTTGFTCKEVAAGTGHFKGAHCKAADAGTGAGANWDHVAIPENTTTEALISSEGTGGLVTPAKLKTTIAGTVIELVAAKTRGEGWGTNAKDPTTGEHYGHGEGINTYSEVTESKLGCEVVGLPGGKGVIQTKQLVGTTKGQGDSGKLTPKEGTAFAEFELKGCAVAGTYKVVGSIKCIPDGTTITCSHEETTAQKTLRLQTALGPVVGVEVSTTYKGRDPNIEGDPFTPVAPTTVETP
ncbi:MAG: hypothetical protein ACOYD4_09095 [Solirubrobacterales bacterium]